MQFKDRTAYVFTAPLAGGVFRLTQMLNAVGSAVNLAYNADGSLAVIKNDASPIQTLLTFAYNGSSLLSTVTDNIGSRVINYTYDAGNNLAAVSQVNSAAALWAYQYTNITNTSNGANVWPLLTQAGVPDATKPTQNQIAYYPKSQTDGIGRITGFTDANNNQRNYNYGGGATTVEAREPDGTLDTTWTQTFDATGATTGTKGADTGTIDAYGNASHIAYTSAAHPKQPTQITNRNNQVTTIAYDSFGNVTNIQTPYTNYAIPNMPDAEILETRFTYTITPDFPFGRLDSVQEGNLTLGKYHSPTKYLYYAGTEIGSNGTLQPKGLLKEIDGPTPGTVNDGVAGSAGNTTLAQQFEYTARGNVSKLTYPAPNATAGATVFYSLDYTTVPYSGAPTPTERLGQPTVVTPPGTKTPSGMVTLNAKMYYDYDGNGNVIYKSDSIGYVTRYEYNPANQPTKVIFPADILNSAPPNDQPCVYMTTAYDYPGGPTNEVKLFNAAKFPYSEIVTPYQDTHYDLGREGEFNTAGGDALTSGRTRDSLYRVKQSQDGRGNPTNFNFDLAGNQKQGLFPNNTSTTPGSYDSKSSTFDADGNPLSLIDGLAFTTTYVLDNADSRLHKILYPDSNPRSDVTLNYDDYGRIYYSEDGVAKQTLKYDDAGNVTDVQTVYKAMTGQPSLNIHYDFFPDGSRKDMMTPAGTYSYSYYDSGQISQVKAPWATGAVIDYYRSNGTLITEQSTLASTGYIYNGRGLLNQITNNTASSTLISQFSNIKYDTQGNRTKTNVSIPYASGSVNGSSSQNHYVVSNGSLQYNYDTLARLTNENSFLDAIGAQPLNTAVYTPGYPLTHGYDAANNLTTLRGQNYSYNKDNQPDNVGGNGNGDTPGGLFDLLSQLLTANTPTGPAFTADYLTDGRRAWKQPTSGQRLYYLYDGDQVIAEISSNGTVADAFSYAAGGLVQRHTASTTYHYSYDPQGNTVGRVSQINGTNGFSTDFVSFYDAFGTRRSQVSSQSGQQFDSPDMVGFKGQSGA